VYGELRLVARRYMKNERQGNTLQTTALVNEVYLRLVDVKNVEWQQRAQFFSMAAQMMRRILVDAARARGSHKRGGAALKVNIDETVTQPGRHSPRPKRAVTAGPAPGNSTDVLACEAACGQCLREYHEETVATAP